jgi:ribonuclease HI
MVNVWVDGSINGHVGKENIHCHGGWYALDMQGKLIHHDSFDMGTNPNFSATSSEFEAIRSSMQWLAQNWEIDFLQINSDSQVAIRQLQSVYQCHSPDLIPRLRACRELEGYFVGVGYNWIRREENKVADALSRCLQEKHGGRHLTHQEVVDLIAQHAIVES